MYVPSRKSFRKLLIQGCAIFRVVMDPRSTTIRGMYGDMCHGYGYASYGTFPANGSVAAMGHDGQLYGPQHLQYASYYQTATPHGLYTPNQVSSSQAEVSALVDPDRPHLASIMTKIGAYGISNSNPKGQSGFGPVRPTAQSISLTSTKSYTRGESAYQDPRYGYDGTHSPSPWFDGSSFSSEQYRPVTTSEPPSTAHIYGASTGINRDNDSAMHMGLHVSKTTSAIGGPNTGYMNRLYPNNRYSQYGSIYRANMGLGPHAHDTRTKGRWGSSYDNTYKPRGRNIGYYGGSNQNLDSLTELNRGPRSGQFRNQKEFEKPLMIAVKGQSLPSSDKAIVCPFPDGKQYNQADFPDNYPYAKFFVMKSYSEDDVHKSVKYNIWASTPNGNKKLDAAYQDAPEKAAGCPIFCFSL